MSDSTNWVLDTSQLAAAIATVARHREISMRDVARETGLSPSTLTRLSKGQQPDADALVSLLFWLKADAAQFTRRRTET